MVEMQLFLLMVKLDRVSKHVSFFYFVFYVFYSGKTFTMGGDLSSVKTDYSHGIYAQTARDIFQRLSLPQYRSSVEIYVTFYEIYCGKVFDLLNNKKRLRVLEDQKGLVQVCDRKEQQVKSVQDVLNIIQRKTIIFFLH
jgi:kinesin family protein 2/24